MSIVSFKLVGKEVFINSFVLDKDGNKYIDPKKRKAPVHDDLTTALNLLKKHLAIMCGQVTLKRYNAWSVTQQEEFLSQFHPHGYSLGGDNKDEGVTLLGHRTIEGGYPLNLVSPFRRFDEKEESRYQLMPELEEVLDRLKDEASEYLDGSKRGNAGQGTLPFDNKSADAKGQNKDEPGVKTHIQEGLGADKEAMDRIMLDAPPPPAAKSNRKRVAQTPANPSGQP